MKRFARKLGRRVAFIPLAFLASLMVALYLTIALVAYVVERLEGKENDIY